MRKQMLTNVSLKKKKNHCSDFHRILDTPPPCQWPPNSTCGSAQSRSVMNTRWYTLSLSPSSGQGGLRMVTRWSQFLSFSESRRGASSCHSCQSSEGRMGDELMAWHMEGSTRPSKDGHALWLSMGSHAEIHLMRKNELLWGRFRMWELTASLILTTVWSWSQQNPLQRCRPLFLPSRGIASGISKAVTIWVRIGLRQFLCYPEWTLCTRGKSLGITTKMFPYKCTTRLYLECVTSLKQIYLSLWSERPRIAFNLKK